MFETFMGLIETLISLASFRQSNREAKSEVISALRNALRQTKLHISSSRVGEFGDDGFLDLESQELAQVWSGVAQKVRPFDKDLAYTFEIKSNYWSNPEGFRREIQNGSQKFHYKFRLHEVEKELINLERQY